jgi:DNA replication regulator DPB11
VLTCRSAPRVPTPVHGVAAPTVVTECWVEGCCFEQSRLPVDRHLVFQPLPALMPIAGTSTFSIHLSGFSTENLTYLRRLIRVIGATQAVSLNRQTTHLVSGKKEGPKVTKAHEWGVKVVSEAWLLAMGRNGQVEPETDYPVDSTSTTTVTDGDGEAVSLPRLTSQTTSQARALKLTPTHVDQSRLSGFISANDSGLGQGSASTSAINAHPLSPPQGASARKLNQALAVEPTHDQSRVSISEESLNAKSGRPAGEAESVGTAGRNREMTDVLRQLAEKGDTSSSRIKAVSPHHSSERETDS